MKKILPKGYHRKTIFSKNLLERSLRKTYSKALARMLITKNLFESAYPNAHSEKLIRKRLLERTFRKNLLESAYPNAHYESACPKAHSEKTYSKALTRKLARKVFSELHSCFLECLLNIFDKVIDILDTNCKSEKSLAEADCSLLFIRIFFMCH